MPIYGINSYIMACRSDYTAAFTIDPLWATSKTLKSQTISFAFTNAKMTTLTDSGVSSRFPRGVKFWVDSVRITVPNLSGLVASNTDIGTLGDGRFNFYVNNGINPPNTFLKVNVGCLNDWIPVSRLVPDIATGNLGWYLQADTLTIQADFRNVDYTVFDGLQLYAYVECKVNAAQAPSP